MPEVVANGLRFNYQRAGAGDRNVVFVHGLVLDNLSSWYLTVAPAVAKRRAVLMYDLRGHGLSEQPPAGYTIDDHVIDLAALLDALGLGTVTLAGNSTGGFIALSFAARFPERVASLVLVDGHTGAPDFGGLMTETFAAFSRQSASADGTARYEAWLEGWLDRHSDAGAPDRDATQTVDMLRRTTSRRRGRLTSVARSLLNDTSFVADVCRPATLSEDDLARVRCPVLAVYGAESDLRAAGERLAARLSSCVLEIVPGCAHGVLFQGRERLQETLLRWLEREGAVSPGEAP